MISGHKKNRQIVNQRGYLSKYQKTEMISTGNIPIDFFFFFLLHFSIVFDKIRKKTGLKKKTFYLQHFFY